MRIARQVYFCGVSGMIGGLLAWLVIGLLNASRWPNIWLATAVQGGGVGTLLVGALTVTRGVVERWGFSRLMSGLRTGVLAGLVAGAIGLSVGQAVFVAVNGGWLGRPAGWLSLCMLIGVTQAGHDSSSRRVMVGLVAGLSSGLGCGLLYEALTQSFLTYSDTAQLWASCVGFMVVGGAFAAGIPAAERLASTAILVIRSGERSGNEFILLDQLLIGSSEECRVLISDDPGIDSRHVELDARPGRIRVNNLGGTPIELNGSAVAPSATAECAVGSRLRVGRTEVVIL